MGVKGAKAGGQARLEMAALKAGRWLEMGPLSAGEEGGTRGVAVKYIDMTKNPDCEGSPPAR